MTNERKLATIRKISEILPIENADFIEIAKIDGWNVVVKKGEFKVGDLVIYFEIDSWIPHELAPFLSKGTEPREYLGVIGERLKTLKLKERLSQGLILPLTNKYIYDRLRDLDLSQLLNVNLYEKPIPINMNGAIKGNFPSNIPKSEQERIQNVYEKYSSLYRDDAFEETVKLDGTSCTVFLYMDEKDVPHVGVCTRNYELEYDKDNIYWKASEIVRKYVLWCYFTFNLKIAVQGEIVGEGINCNRERKKCHHFYIFDMINLITEQKYMNCETRQFYIQKGIDHGFDLQHVPVLNKKYKIFQFNSVEKIIDKADNLIIDGIQKEGIVYKNLDKPWISFKVINNSYLLEHD